MSLSSISIKRPVLSIVLSITILIFGMLGFLFLGVREFPSVDPPIVNVFTSYVGANADVIETQITENLEQSINGVAGIKSLSSSSRDGSSRISVEFELGVDMETATNDVRDRVSRAQYLLPADVTPPVVSKADADAEAIVYVGLKSSTYSLLELSEIAEKMFKERLQTIPGVSEAQIWGERRYSMRLYLQAEKLTAYSITPMDIRTALSRENIELPSGRVEGQNLELAVRTSGRLSSVEDFNNLIIKSENNKIVRLKDIATVQLAPENEKTITRNNGVPVVGIVLIPQPGTNQIAIADEYYKRTREIEKDLPDGVEMVYGFDDTRFVRKSITEVRETIILAFLLVVFVIFIFLRNWRTTLIPVMAIPVSLVGSFFVMYLFGFSINVLSLLGIVLSIGLVVDDAIVVMENIYSKIEKGMPSKQAALEGSREIIFAVISTTITLVAVFLPVIFLQGMTGRLFREFGIVISGAVIISSFVALTLSPMMCAYLLKKSPKKKSKIEIYSQAILDRITAAYKNSLDIFMKRPWMVGLIILVSLVLMYLSFADLKSELAPLEDRDSISMRITAQEGYSYESMDDYVLTLTEMIREVVDEDEMEGFITNTSPAMGGATNSASIRILLKPAEERKRSQQEISAALGARVKKLNAANVMINQPATIKVGRGGGGGTSIQFVIQAQNHSKLREALPRFIDAAKSSSYFSYIDANLKYTKPEIKIEINREKAKDLGVTVLDIAQTLQFGLSGQRYGYFVMNGKQYQVIGQLDRKDRSKPTDITGLYVRNVHGQLVQIDNLVEIVEQANPPQLFRYNRYVSATITAQLSPGIPMGEGIKELEKIAEKELDESFRTVLTGQAYELQNSSGTIVYAFLLSLLLIYLVLSAQFESFRDPFIIMFTVPLALAGALISLWWFRQTLNIFSEIGIIMLIGLVTKNGILIVEFANQIKGTGVSLKEAVLQAAETRFRPILMTSLATIFGMLPIALAFGAGSESRVSMGIAVTGGMTLATLLSLYVVPVVYTWFSKPIKIQNTIPIIVILLLFVPFTGKAQEPAPVKLTLDSALIQVLQNNYDIKIAKLESEKLGVNAHIGEAGMLPSLNFNANYQNVNPNEADNIHGGLALNWTVFDGFKMFSTYQRLKDIAVLGEAQFRAQVEQSLVETYQTYLTVVLKQQEVKVMRQTMEVSRQRFAIVQDKYEIGRASMLDVYNAKVDFYTDSSMFMRQKEGLKNVKISLNALLARDLHFNFYVEDSIQLKAGLDYDTLSKKTRTENVSLLQARIAQQISYDKYKESKATYYPNLSLHSSYNFLNSTTSNQLYYGATFSWKLFDGFTQKNIRKIASMDKDIADLSYKQSLVTIQQNLLQRYISYRSSFDISLIERENMDAAEKNMEISLERYKLGSLSSLELRESQRNYLNASTRLLLSVYETKVSEVILEMYSGEMFREIFNK